MGAPDTRFRRGTLGMYAPGAREDLAHMCTDEARLCWVRFFSCSRRSNRTFWGRAARRVPTFVYHTYCTVRKCEQVGAAAPEHGAARRLLIGPGASPGWANVYAELDLRSPDPASSRWPVLCRRICDAAAPRSGRGPSGGRGWPWRTGTSSGRGEMSDQVAGCLVPRPTRERSEAAARRARRQVASTVPRPTRKRSEAPPPLCRRT